MKKAEDLLESLVFRSRWLLAPFFFGLILAIAALLVKFAKQLAALFVAVVAGGEQEVIVSILALIDSALIASLLLIIAFSGYENFVSKIGTGDHEDRPAWWEGRLLRPEAQDDGLDRRDLRRRASEGVRRRLQPHEHPARLAGGHPPRLRRLRRALRRCQVPHHRGRDGCGEQRLS